ncbi:hypothetical protein Q4530_07760 [Colwellia sp. 1_MG-2023]|uniref:hypothetical protein n=1 Tax=unclassified Colwellia TaxID=196834 RepID=UPI001C097DFE|nr:MULTISPECIES: hypothetical protein [unclassified Colwellia]MBU2926356.1 hypothetical protein [Colwellia sp. C2M11]MDO6651794.1 hypothetical protein [Colwellia sp. 3_MG-2023]MDO6665295.1 hypothetical protein [Colwellia sp. 2_MG-2023]MDO6689668.1 hypothetical protein [Colwellia sp. 1_MG-2023]
MQKDNSYATPYLLGILCAFFVLILWYFSCLVIEKEILPNSFDLFIGFIITMVATATGAYLAFSYRTREKKIETKDKEVESLNNALISLARQRSLVQGIQLALKDRIDINNFSERLSKAQGVTQDIVSSNLILPLGKQVYVDINSLTFLIKSNNSSLLKSVIDSENIFNELLTKIDSLNCMQSKSKKNNDTVIAPPKNSSEVDINNKVEKVLVDIESVLTELYDEANKLFVGYDFINF